MPGLVHRNFLTHALRRWISVSSCAALLTAPLGAVTANADEEQQKKKAQTVVKAAGIGALMSVVFGGGAKEIATGAAISAGLTAAINPDQAPRVAKTAKPGEVAEPRVFSAEDGQEVALSEREWALEPQGEDEAKLVEAIGADNWEGYKALRACQHDHASECARAAAGSDNEEYKMASVWLDAIIAIDVQDADGARAACGALAERDPDVTTKQQARAAAEKIVAEMRGEREALGIGPCQ